MKWTYEQVSKEMKGFLDLYTNNRITFEKKESLVSALMFKSEWTRRELLWEMTTKIPNVRLTQVDASLVLFDIGKAIAEITKLFTQAANDIDSDWEDIKRLRYIHDLLTTALVFWKGK